MICMLVPCLSKPILRQNGSQEEGEVDYQERIRAISQSA